MSPLAEPMTYRPVGLMRYWSDRSLGRLGSRFVRSIAVIVTPLWWLVLPRGDTTVTHRTNRPAPLTVEPQGQAECLEERVRSQMRCDGPDRTVAEFHRHERPGCEPLRGGAILSERRRRVRDSGDQPRTSTDSAGRHRSANILDTSKAPEERRHRVPNVVAEQHCEAVNVASLESRRA